MKYLKTYNQLNKIFEFIDYIDMAHFEKFLDKQQIEELISDLENILLDLSDSIYSIDYGVDDIDYKFYINIHKGKEFYEEDIDDLGYDYDLKSPQDPQLEEVLLRIDDYMIGTDWLLSMSCIFFDYRDSIGNMLGKIQRMGEHLYLYNPNVHGEKRPLISDVKTLYKIRLDFLYLKTGRDTYIK